MRKIAWISYSAGVASTAICLIAPTTAKAEYDVKTALRVYDTATPTDRKIWELIFGNTQNGINWANSVLIRTKQQPLYCPPDDSSLTGPQVVEMLRGWASSDPKFGGVPYGFGVLLARQKSFPVRTDNDSFEQFRCGSKVENLAPSISCPLLTR